MSRLLVMASVLWIAVLATSALAQRLEVQRDHFTVDGSPKFLIFVSYFDAMRREASGDATPFKEDFDFFAAPRAGAPGVDGIRIFVNWWAACAATAGCEKPQGATDTLFDSTGTIQSGASWRGPGHDPWTRFVNVLKAAKDSGLLVEITFTRETFATPPSKDAYRTGIVNVVRRLRSEHPDLTSHVFYDVQNEWIDEGGLTGTDLRALVSAVHVADPAAIVTGSQNTTPENAAANAVASGFDIVAYHDCRPPCAWFSSDKIAADIRAIRTSAAIPIAYTEPQRWQADDAASHFADAARYARQHGAALWLFHSWSGFGMACKGCTYRSFANPAEEAALLKVRAASAPGF